MIFLYANINGPFLIFISGTKEVSFSYPVNVMNYRPLGMKSVHGSTHAEGKRQRLCDDRHVPPGAGVCLWVPRWNPAGPEGQGPSLLLFLSLVPGSVGLRGDAPQLPALLVIELFDHQQLVVDFHLCWKTEKCQ